MTGDRILHSRFRKGWARAREGKAEFVAHYFTRHELGEATSICSHDVRLPAGDLLEPGAALRCKRCRHILATETVP